MDAPETIEELREHLGRAVKIIADRHDDYVDAQEFYDGTRAEVADSRAAEAIVRQSKATPLSFAHIPVDVIADKVELASVTSANAAARAALEAWADANDLDDEAIDWVRKACMFGDYYVVTDPTGLDDDGAFTVEDIDAVGMSPLSTVVVYDKKTGRKKLYGAHLWDAGTKERPLTRAILYYDDCSVKLVAEKKDASDENLFELDYPADGEPEDAFLEHDGDRMLISHLPIGGKPYGVPVHRKAYGPQDAITKVSANNLVNVDAQGLPSRWALLDPNAEIDDDVDDDFGTDGPSTTADKSDGRRDATTGRRVRTLPGAIEFLRGVSDTGTYEAATSDPFLANLDWYVRAMAVACGIALHEFDMKGEQPSGESRRRAEARSNRIAARIKRQAGAFFRDLADTVLGLAGQKADVTVTFNPSETGSDKDGLELVGLKVKHGVPVRQALLEAGYGDEQVNRWYPANAPALSPDLLSILAEVLAKLGNARTLGAIDEAGIEAMIPELFRYIETAEVEEGPDPLADVVTNPAAMGLVTDPASDLKARFDALGVAIRAGVDQQQAAAKLGLDGLTFPNLPTTIRVPESETVGLEETP